MKRIRICENLFMFLVYIFCIQRGLLSELVRHVQHLIRACVITNVNQNTFSDINYEKKVSLCLNYFLRCVSRCHNITNECILSLSKESKEKVKKKKNKRNSLNVFLLSSFPKRISNGLIIMVVIQPSSYMYQIKKNVTAKAR